MKISWNWLNDWIDLSEYSPKKIADLLTIKVCEVEEIYIFASVLNQISIAQVSKLEKHPNADKLNLCKVNTGSEIIQIVTGAPNVVEGGKYPLASIGVTLPNGMTMKKAKLRGLESFGMLCSAQEIGLEQIDFPPINEKSANDPHGLLTLEPNWKVGSKISDYWPFTDHIFDIDNKSITHRPDLWSHFGFARELSALLNLPLKKKLESKLPNHDPSIITPEVSIHQCDETKDALAYMGLSVSNISVKRSPIEIQARLIAIEQNPRNNIVDASNYIMFDIGQPNHAFDAKKINAPVKIKKTEKRISFITLEGETQIIEPKSVMIYSGDTPIALGGIIGGKNSSVNEKTTNLFLESACFRRSDIRKTSWKMKLRTDASQRFEKGIDPALADKAIPRLLEIIALSCPEFKIGQLKSGIEIPKKENIIELSISFLRSKLGDPNIPVSQTIKILTRLGMQVEEGDDLLRVKIPSWRSWFDIEIPEDLVEEIGRVIGYSSIPEKPLITSIAPPPSFDEQYQLESQLREILAVGFGYTEVYNYSFLSEQDCKIDSYYSSSAISLANPIQKETPFLRNSPLPALLENIRCLHKKYFSLRMFEIEKIFLPSKLRNRLPEELKFLAGISFIKKDSERKAFLSMVNLLNAILKKIGVDSKKTIAQNHQNPIFHPGRSGQICYNDIPLFRFGQIHPRLCENLPNIFYFDTLLNNLSQIPKRKSYQPPPRYPAASFEATILAKTNQNADQIYQCAGLITSPTKKDKTYIENIQHLDTFTDEKFGEETRAISIKITWRNPMRSLESNEVKQLQNQFLANLKKNGFCLR